jgi:hypothetical protein
LFYWPEWGRNAWKGRVRLLFLCEVAQAGEDEDTHGQEEHEETQLFVAVLQCKGDGLKKLVGFTKGSCLWHLASLASLSGDPIFSLIKVGTFYKEEFLFYISKQPSLFSFAMFYLKSSWVTSQLEDSHDSHNPEDLENLKWQLFVKNFQWSNFYPFLFGSFKLFLALLI